MVIRLALALALALPAPVFAQVAGIASVRAPVGGAAAGVGAAGAAALGSSTLSRPALSVSPALPVSALPAPHAPVTGGPSAARSLTPAALPAGRDMAVPRAHGVVKINLVEDRRPAKTGTLKILFKRRNASNLLHYRKKRGGGGSAGVGDMKVGLDELFDGIARGKVSMLGGLVFDRYDPEIYSKGHIADSRYSGMLARSWPLLSTSHERVRSKTQQLRLRSQNALLERVKLVDPNTYSHSIRVALLSGLLAMQMGFSHIFAGRLAWAAAFHDAGKLNVEVLRLVNKKGKLTAAERKIVNRHPVLGARKLLNLYGLPRSLRLLAARVALNHHERKDGSGYPRSLRDEDIPLESRIIAVADVFDALMEDRPYRAGMSWEDAFSTMEREAKSYDREVWDAFVEMTRALLGPLIPDPAEQQVRLAA